MDDSQFLVGILLQWLKEIDVCVICVVFNGLDS